VPGETEGEPELDVVILAGGRGERLWPLSRPSFPKQFHAFHGPTTLIQDTFERAATLAPRERIHAVTTSDLAHLVLLQLPDMPPSNLIVEPLGRNTAASVALAAHAIEGRQGDATIAFLPSDHAVLPGPDFRRTLARAADVAGRSRSLVIIGLRPTRPDARYGYIEPGQALPLPGDPPIRLVTSFHEKPPAEEARSYVDRGFFWNSGIFVGRASTFLRLIHEHAPEISDALDGVPAAAPMTDLWPQEAIARWGALAGGPFDRVVLEETDDLLVVEGAFRWDDLGSWGALERVLAPDILGNTTRGPSVSLATTGSTVINEDPSGVVATLGLSDLLVVRTKGAVLVAAKDRLADLADLMRAVEGSASAVVPARAKA